MGIFKTAAIVLGLAVLCTHAHALEATAQNDVDVNASLITRTDAQFAQLLAALNALQARVTTLENRPSGTATLRFMHTATAVDGATSALQRYDICVLSRMQIATAEDNHGHSCQVTQSSNGFRLQSTRSPNVRTTCAMQCYNLE